MKPLTPLRFVRQPISTTGGLRNVPRYGLGAYITNCGRFTVFKTDGGWDVVGNYGYIQEALDDAGLGNQAFGTRTAVVETLIALREDEELY